MPLATRKRTLALKAEGTYGTIETLTNAEAFRVNNPQMKYVGSLTTREESTGILGHEIGIPNGRYVELTFQNHLHGDGTSGDPAWASALFPSVGMPSPSANTYTTSSTTTDWKGLSAALNRDGKRRTGRGGMGNLKMSFEAGKPVVLDWKYIMGFAANATDTSQLSSISFEGAVPPIFANASALTMDSSTAFKIGKMELDLGTNPFARQDANATGGYIGGWLQNILPVITLDPEAVTVATKDWDAYFAAGTTFNIVAVVGTAAGNTATITASTCQLQAPTEDADRNGIYTDSLSLIVTGTTSIVFS